MLLYTISKFLDNPYREDLIFKISLVFSIFINLIIWLVLYFKLQPFSYLSDYGQVYLHYNIYFGIDSIGAWYMSLILPLLGLIVIIINNILAYLFYLREKMISYILLISQAIIQVILLAAAAFIVLLNI